MLSKTAQVHKHGMKQLITGIPVKYKLVMLDIQKWGMFVRRMKYKMILQQYSQNQNPKYMMHTILL